MTIPFAQCLVEDVILAGAERFTDEILDVAALRLLDTVGVTLAGSRMADGSVMADVLLAGSGDGASGGALVLGRAQRLSAIQAATANGVAAHALDYDDTNTGGTVHVGSVVVPAVMALAEVRRCSGRAVLEAITVGYQVATVLGRLAESGFMGSNSATCALFGATAACARLIGLNEAAAVHALGLAGSFVAGTSEYLAFGRGDNKQIQHGCAAGNAVTVTLLAAHGASGPASIFEGPFGVFPDRARKPMPARAQTMDLWERVELLTASVKPYPACHCLLPFAETWLSILAQLRGAGLDPFTDLDRVTCLANPISEKFMLHPMAHKAHPNTAHQARFSLPWCLAKLAFDGRLGPAAFRPEWLDHPKIVAFAGKIDYVIEPPDPDKAVKGEIHGGLRVLASNGSTFEAYSWRHRGGPSRQFSKDEIEAKFMEATEECGAPEARQRVRQAAAGLKTAPDIRPLVASLETT